MSTAVIVGATGLVGSHCLKALRNSQRYEKIVSLQRNTHASSDDKLQIELIDFDKIDQLPAAWFDGADVFCCLGTTIKQAGSRDAFRRVDYHYVVNLARHAANNGAKKFLVVSSLGASTSSPAFYSRVKGEMQATVSALPFDAVHIFQPSLLMGDRDEFRLGEEVGKKASKLIAPFLHGRWKRYQPTPAAQVAADMVSAAATDHIGSHIHVFE